MRGPAAALKYGGSLTLKGLRARLPYLEARPRITVTEGTVQIREDRPLLQAGQILPQGLGEGVAGPPDLLVVPLERGIHGSPAR